MGKSLDHPYVARVELTHGTPLSIRECWEEVVQEPAVVGVVPLGPNTVSQSLALALARPVSSNLLGGQQTPKLSKIFTDPGTYDGSRGKKFEEWWTCVHMWQDENAATLAGVASIHAVPSNMVGRDTSTFAHAQLNEMIRGKKWTWQEFTTLVKSNFWSTNEKDWNQKALSTLRQGLTPMDMFITRFDIFQALAEYPKDRLIELLEQNAD